MILLWYQTAVQRGHWRGAGKTTGYYHGTRQLYSEDTGYELARLQDIIMVPDSCTTLTRGEDTGEVLARIHDIIMVPDSCTLYREDTGYELARLQDIIMVPDKMLK